MTSPVRRSRRPAALAAVLLTLTLATGACDAAGEPTVAGDGTRATAPTGAASSSATDPTSPTTGATDRPTRSAGPEDTSEPPHDGPATTETSIDPEPETAGTEPGSGAPTSYADAVDRVARVESKSTTLTHRRFSTPGDLVYCVLRHQVIPAGCELSRGAIRDPDLCATALGDAVGRIEFTPQGALPQCNTDTIREPGAPVVELPSAVVQGGVRCAVEEAGTTCVDGATQTGFFLAPGYYATFE